MSYAHPQQTLRRRLQRLVARMLPTWAGRQAAEELLRPPAQRLPVAEYALLGEAQRRRFRLGTTALAWGRPGRPEVLLLPGWGGRPTQFESLIRLLLAQGWRVIALDPPGHGPCGQGQDTHVLAFARAALEAAAELPALRAAVGHSMGGSGLLLACHLGLAVERVATVAAPSSLSRQLRRRAAGLGFGPPATAALFATYQRRLGTDIARVDVAAALAGLRQPGLLLHDHDDRDVPFAEAEALAKAWPLAVLRDSRGLGHCGLLRDPAALRELAGFLRAAAAPRLRVA